MQWDVIFITVVTSGLTSGVVTALIGWWHSAHDETKRQKSEAKYLAIQLVVILEKFASDCIYRQWHDEHSLKIGRTDISDKLPEITTFPQDAAHWKSLHKDHPKLVEQALLFPNRLASAEASAEFSKKCEGIQASIYGSIVVTGWDALTLAKDLRSAFKMSASSIQDAEALEREYQSIQTRRVEWKAQWEASHKA